MRTSDKLNIAWPTLLKLAEYEKRGSLSRAFEDGVHAVIEALRKEALVTVPEEYVSIMVNFSVTPHAKGVLVFIPDDPMNEEKESK